MNVMKSGSFFLKGFFPVSFIVITVFMTENVMALSLVYDGYACNNYVYSVIPTSEPRNSIFEVLSDEGGGVYLLKLKNGLPRFDEELYDVCVDSGAMSIGYRTNRYVPGAGDLAPEKMDSNEVLAYFTGQQLIVVVHALHYGDTGNVYEYSAFSGMITPYSTTLIFDYNSSNQSFILRKMLTNMGSVRSTVIYGPQSNHLIDHLEPSLSKSARSPLSDIVFYLRD